MLNATDQSFTRPAVPTAHPHGVTTATLDRHGPHDSHRDHPHRDRPPCTTPLIELRGVTKRFGSKLVLDGIDLKLYANQAVAFIGPSGTGKSTIMRIISGLLEPDAGEVYVAGQRRQGLMGDTREQEGVDLRLVFQQAALFDSLTVAENVGFSLLQHSSLSAAEILPLVERALARVGLPGVGDRYPAELSGGMRKRVSFARAIIENPTSDDTRPELLLYDEPTAGLDPIASTIVEDLMRDLSRQVDNCSTYAVVTHQDSTIRRTADRVVFLYGGQIRWDGPVTEIDRTDNPYVRQFFSSAVDGPIRVAG
ncbi:MAG: ABC transporter ATP-binding protein [Cyanophyceae cyanobacterium]